jgi:glycosyltransferase involved in cell wall biosynthesis
MLIAHVITRLLQAGSEENTIATCLAQAKAGHEVLLLHGCEWSAVQRDKCGTSIRLIEIADLVHKVDPGKDLKAILSMRALFRKRRPTVVHTHQSKAGILGRIAARMVHIPVIIHGVHILPFINVGFAEKAVYLAAERVVAIFTDAFINVSEGTRQSCLEHGVGRPEQHFVAHSGFDVMSFRNAVAPAEWRTIAGVSAGAERPPIVLMLAALEKRKRHVAFLELFDRVVKRVPTIRLLIAGEGPTRQAVETTIKRCNLAANVHMLGFRACPEQLIALSDLTILTSIREGLPRVIVQSLASGKPVITTNLPGISEIVKDGINGVITASDDLKKAVDTVGDILLDKERLWRMQAAAASSDVSSWRVEAMCSAIAEVYETLTRARSHI